MKTRIYKDKGGQWRWTLTASNGNKLADSGEGYANKIDCTNALERVTRARLIQMLKNDFQLWINNINGIGNAG